MAAAWQRPSDEEIAARLRIGEDSGTEFKSVASNHYRLDADDLAKAVCGLANTAGGRVFVGVENDGTATGVGSTTQADAVLNQVSGVCRHKIEFPITCPAYKVDFRGVCLIVVEVPGFDPARPFAIEGRFYIRDGAQTRPATPAEVRRLVQSADYHFDEQPVKGASRDDLNEEAILHYMESAYGLASNRDPDRYLTEMKSLTQDGQPTVSGILFFGRTPERFFPDARITAIRFPTPGISGEFVDRKEIRGPLPIQFQVAMSFLEQHIGSPSSVEGWERHERGVSPEIFIPAKAAREGLRNALMHRDYRVTAQVRLFLFPDRLEITNPATLLNRLTLDNIRVGISQRRNPAVCMLLNRLERTESTGIGVPEMIRTMTESGLPEPEISMEGGEFRLVLWGRRASEMQ